MKQTGNQQLEAVFRKVFGVEELTDDLSIDSIAQWDSLAHIGLILALEAEFSVQIPPEQAVEMISVRAIREILSERGVYDA